MPRHITVNDGINRNDGTLDVSGNLYVSGAASFYSSASFINTGEALTSSVGYFPFDEYGTLFGLTSNNNTISLASTAGGVRLIGTEGPAVHIQRPTGYLETINDRSGLDIHINNSSGAGIGAVLYCGRNVDDTHIEAFICVDFGEVPGVSVNSSSFIITSNVLNSTPVPRALFSFEGGDDLNVRVEGEHATKFYGDIEVTGSANGMILSSPDGSRWRVSITDLGVFSGTKL